MSQTIQFRIEGTEYGVAHATVYATDGVTVKRVYTAGANVDIIIDETCSPIIKFEANVKSSYLGYCKFNGWYAKETLSNGIISTDSGEGSAPFMYNVSTNSTTFIRANFTAIENMLVKVYVYYDQTEPSIEGISYASGNGSYLHNTILKISATLKDGYIYDATNKWEITKTLRNGGTKVTTYSNDTTYKYTVDATYSSVSFKCLIHHRSTNAGDFTIGSGPFEVGGNFNIGLSSNIYKTGCKCKWLLKVPDATNVNVYKTYGDNNDWLYQIWKDYSQPTFSQGIVNVQLPLPSQLTQIFAGYKSNVSSLDCKLVLKIDASGCNSEVYVLDDKNNYRNFNLTISSDFKPKVENVTITYDKTFRFTPTGSISDKYVLVSSWSRFKGGYTTSSIVSRLGSGINYLKVNSAEVLYNDTETPSYTHGEDYEWHSDLSGDYGTGSIGNTDFVTLGELTNDLSEHQITIIATNTADISTEYNWTNSQYAGISVPTVYAWYKPVYTLKELYRCDENGVKQEAISLNKYIYIRFSLECSPIMFNNINYNYIGTFTEYEITYASSQYLRILINGQPFGTDNKIVYEGNNIYHVIIGTEEHQLDYNSNYTICIYYRDCVKKYFDDSESTTDKKFFTLFQPVYSQIPLSLYQDDDTNKAGVGLGVEVHNPGYITLGADSVFDTDVNLIASKTIATPSGSGTDTVYAQVNAYDLVNKGETVCVPSQDLTKGMYTNNIRVLTKTEYTNLSSKDAHTLYIIYKE